MEVLITVLLYYVPTRRLCCVGASAPQPDFITYVMIWQRPISKSRPAASIPAARTEDTSFGYCSALAGGSNFYGPAHRAISGLQTNTSGSSVIEMRSGWSGTNHLCSNIETSDLMIAPRDLGNLAW